MFVKLPVETDLELTSAIGTGPMPSQSVPLRQR